MELEVVEVEMEQVYFFSVATSEEEVEPPYQVVQVFQFESGEPHGCRRVAEPEAEQVKVDVQRNSKVEPELPLTKSSSLGLLPGLESGPGLGPLILFLIFCSKTLATQVIRLYHLQL